MGKFHSCGWSQEYRYYFFTMMSLNINITLFIRMMLNPYHLTSITLRLDIFQTQVHSKYWGVRKVG